MKFVLARYAWNKPGPSVTARISGNFALELADGCACLEGSDGLRSFLLLCFTALLPMSQLLGQRSGPVCQAKWSAVLLLAMCRGLRTCVLETRCLSIVLETRCLFSA